MWHPQCEPQSIIWSPYPSKSALTLTFKTYVIQIHTDPFYSGFCGLRSQRKQQCRHLWGVSIVMVRRGNSSIKSQLVFWDWWSKIDALIVACRWICCSIRSDIIIVVFFYFLRCALMETDKPLICMHISMQET